MNEEFCCEMMAENIASEDEIIGYWSKFREYGIFIHDGGSSMSCIQYCPWCGKKLPASLREDWFDRLAELGIDDPEKAPSEMQDDTWWKSGNRTEAKALKTKNPEKKMNFQPYIFCKHGQNS